MAVLFVDITSIMCIVLCYAPVLCENVNRKWMVGAVGHVQTPHLRNEGQEEASYSLLTIWNSAHNTHLEITNDEAEQS